MRHYDICPTCDGELRRKWVIEAVQASNNAHDIRAEIVGSARRLEAILRVAGAPPEAADELAALNELVERLFAAEMRVARLAEQRAEAREARAARKAKRGKASG